MKTNAEEAITAIAKTLLDYSREFDGIYYEESEVLRAVCAARQAFKQYGIPVHINSEACVNARITLRNTRLEKVKV